jgi:mannose-6-phosphate isomerase-like protein (cupin superfamily)
MSYIKNIALLTEQNTAFRTVLYTGEKTQLVLMDIPPAEEIGEELHPHVEQILFVQSGYAKVILDGKETDAAAGDVVIVTPGVKHNVINSGINPLKIYTVYAPANHIDGRVHQTKADAEADTEDEAFGEAVT